MLLAVIGPSWLTVKDKSGGRRLDDPLDVVQLEIRAALDLRIPIIPVLVGGAAMPSKTDLPYPLERLAYFPSHELSDSHWESDSKILVRNLETILGRPVSKTQHRGEATIGTCSKYSTKAIAERFAALWALLVRPARQ